MIEHVNHPAHYNTGKIEVITVIEDWDLDFSLGNAIKYIGRAGHKNPDKIIEDLEKAIWYIERHKKYGKFGITTIIRYNIRRWFDDAYTIEEIVNDWNLNSSLRCVIEKIYFSRLKSKEYRDFYLDVAISFLESEIFNIQKNGRRS